MKRNSIVIVSTKFQAVEEITAYTQAGQLPHADVVFVIEFHDCPPPAKLPERCIPVSDFADKTAVAIAVEKLAEYGPFDAAVSYDEVSMMTAAKIRAKYGLPGLSEEQALPYRDKVLMKEILRAAKIRVPRVYSADALRRGAYKLPLVCKPRSLAGSEGVRILRDTESVSALLVSLPESVRWRDELDPNDFQVEEYIEGPIFHIDGIVMDGRLTYSVTSAYIGSCLDYLHGEPLASQMLPPGSHSDEWHQYTAGIVKAMNMPDGVFHLEAFQTRKGERIFLEIGLRPGGGLLVPAMKKARGLDLQLIHIQAQLGMRFETQPQRDALAGFVMLPVNCGLAADTLADMASWQSRGVETASSFGPGAQTDQLRKLSGNLGELLFTGTDWQDITEAVCGVLAAVKLKRSMPCQKA